MLTEEQINFLLAMLNQAPILGAHLDVAYGTKQALVALKLDAVQAHVVRSIESKD